MMEKRSYSHIVKEKNQKKLHSILNWREEKKKGIAIQQADDMVPITYEG